MTSHSHLNSIVIKIFYPTQQAANHAEYYRHPEQFTHISECQLNDNKKFDMLLQLNMATQNLSTSINYRQHYKLVKFSFDDNNSINTTLYFARRQALAKTE
jgi:hypothetical protein